MVYLIKLTEQKDANVILTRKCFTIAIKTIQLSSHITKHDEFIKATFSSEILFETNNIFPIRGNLSFKKFLAVTFHIITGLPMGKPSRGLRFVCLFSFFSFFIIFFPCR